MPITIGNNIASLGAQRALSRASEAQSSTFQKLSSGLRINKASDDAAGLAVGAALRADARVFAQAIRNVNDGISALNIAQGAIEQLSVISIRQKELAAQAANGSYTTEQRRALNAEANALVSEFNRIVGSAEFNGVKLTETSTALRLQAGYGTDGGLALALNNELSRAVGNGSFYESFASTEDFDLAISVALGDVNQDGNTDVVSVTSFNVAEVMLANANGTLRAPAAYALSDSPYSATLADLNRDGTLDIVGTSSWGGVSVLMGNANGTYKAETHYTAAGADSVALGDMNGDGLLDAATANFGNDSAGILIGNGNGTFRAVFTMTAGIQPTDALIGDLNGDEKPDILIVNQGNGFPGEASVSAFINQGNGLFQPQIPCFSLDDMATAGKLGDLNGDGVLDLILRLTTELRVGIGNGDGTFTSAQTIASVAESPNIGDINGDGFLDLAVTGLSDDAIYFGNGDGTLRKATQLPSDMLRTSALGDMNNDGVLDLVGGEVPWGSTRVWTANTDRVTTMPYLNMNNRPGALAALDTVTGVLTRVSRELGMIGSAQSRMEVTLKTLSTSIENYFNAAGRIFDVDVAAESAALLQNQILKETGAAVLSQANAQPALALQLLRA